MASMATFGDGWYINCNYFVSGKEVEVWHGYDRDKELIVSIKPMGHTEPGSGFYTWEEAVERFNEEFGT